MLVVFVVEGDGWRDSSWLRCKGTVVVICCWMHGITMATGHDLEALRWYR
jgi:hypothetical protein